MHSCQWCVTTTSTCLYTKEDFSGVCTVPEYFFCKLLYMNFQLLKTDICDVPMSKKTQILYRQVKPITVEILAD